MDNHHNKLTDEERIIVATAAKTILQAFELTGLNLITINAVMDQIRINMEEKFKKLSTVDAAILPNDPYTGEYDKIS